jgi:hypothetical protein
MLKKLLTISALTVALTALSSAASASYVEKNEAVLRALDKITGRVSVIQMQIGQVAHFGSLAIVANACKTRPPEEDPENAAFLEIRELKQAEDAKLIFSGWMFSSSPALSAIEHPVYDIWVVKCQDREDEVDGINKLIEENSVQ